MNHPDLPEDLLTIFDDRQIGIDGWPVQAPYRYRSFDYLSKHPEIGARETKRLLQMWLDRADWAKRRTGRLPFNLDARKKLIAADEARDLLLHFDKKISAAKGSTFCKLAALLLYGTKRAHLKLQWACRAVIRNKNWRKKI
jgi:hypothetical protein